MVTVQYIDNYSLKLQQLIAITYINVYRAYDLHAIVLMFRVDSRTNAFRGRDRPELFVVGEERMRGR